MSVKRLATLIVAVLMLGALLPATVLAVPTKTSNSPCPSSNALGTFVPATNVGATSSGATTRTYSFVSFVNENPTNGVPGLVGYCVYTNLRPSGVATSVPNWTATVLKGSKGFVFARGDNPRGSGYKYNVPLDGGTHTIGTATFPTEPADQIILLHINDVAQCTALYGGLSPSTCWVLPGEAPPTGPICDAAASGDANAAYNDIPKDAVDCGPPSEAFEAQSAREFGDEVTLAVSGTLASLTVLFNSYACEDHPLWNNSECTTNVNGHTFSHTITAHIYDPTDLTTPIATATQSFAIPFRPSADNVKCTGADTGGFFNPISGNCEFSIKTLLTFTDWDTTPNLSGNVVWTVAYNTTHFGNPPIGEGAACYGTTAGCPYDSLNVGTKTFPNAPYAGTFADPSDAFLDSSWTGAYCDNGLGGTGTLRQDASCWTGFQPLGKIVLAP